MSTLIYGKNTCLEVLKTDRQIFQAYLMENTNQDLLHYLKSYKIKYDFLDKHTFKKKFMGNHQGVVFEVEDYQVYDMASFIETIDRTSNPLVIMLDHITDVHNLGAIIRSAEAGGVAGIIIPKDRSAKINGVVAKTSSGAIEHVKIVEVTNITNTIQLLKDDGFWIVGTDLEAEQSYQEIIIDTPLCLVIGSEGKGISKLVKNSVDYNVKIDMVGKINSLNASVSTGILIFDILRRKLNK